MKLILEGTATEQFTEKTVEIGGKQIAHILGVLQTSGGPLPITVWGEAKGRNWKGFVQTGEQMSIVVELQAKPQTYTNHEGETVQVPNIQLKLYSFLTMPKTVEQTKYPTESVAADPAQSFYFAPPPQKKKDIEDTDPTGSFRCFTEEEKKQLEKPFSPSWINHKVQPWGVRQ